MRIVWDAYPRSKALDSDQDQTRVLSNKLIEYKNLGSSIDLSKEQKLNNMHKNEAADAVAKACVEARAAGFSNIPRNAERASLSSSSPKAAIGSLESEETSDDEEIENVTPEMARKIVSDLLAEYTTLSV